MKKTLIPVLLLFTLLACSESTPKLVIEPEPPKEKAISDGNEIFDPRVDILFVIDSSGSMHTHQRNLAYNADRFIDNFVKTGNLDFNIGVVTTDMEGSYYNGGACCGKMNGTIPVVNRRTPNFVQVLAQNFMVGTNGSAWEKSFEPVVAALSEPNLSGHNAGFYRSNVPLAIIFITDAEDQSRINPNQLMHFLQKLKPRSEDVLAYGVIVPSSENFGCPRDEYDTKPVRLEEFLSKVSNAPNNIMNLCDPDFGDKLAEMGNDLKRRVGRTIYLNRPPVIDTIRVSFGSQIIPKHIDKGWSYDASLNAVILGDQIEWTEQPENTKVRVQYEVAVIRE